MAPLIAPVNEAFAPEAQGYLKLPVVKLLDRGSCDRILVTAVCPLKDARLSQVTEPEPCALQAHVTTLSLVELTSQARKQGLVRKSGQTGRLEATPPIASQRGGQESLREEAADTREELPLGEHLL